MDIKKIREDLGMSQSEFANHFGFNIDTLQNITVKPCPIRSDAPDQRTVA